MNPERLAAQPPIVNAYCVSPGLLYAGEYPGSRPHTPDAQTNARLAAFLDAGITAYIDITEPQELNPYAESLQQRARARHGAIIHQRHAIRDVSTCTESTMRGILDAIDAHHAAARSVYVHCWGGIGRTGMVVGCWLVRHGATPEQALAQVSAGWKSMSPDKLHRNAGKTSPETTEQIPMVRACQPNT